jgi:hypothetical protein
MNDDCCYFWVFMMLNMGVHVGCGNRSETGLVVSILEEPVMDKISNTTGVNLAKVMFGIFLILAIKNK